MRLTADELRVLRLSLDAHAGAQEAVAEAAKAEGDRLRWHAASKAVAATAELLGKVEAEQRRRDTEVVKQADAERAGPVN